MPDPIEVVHQPKSQRYIADLNGSVSVCEYEVVDGTIVLTHTFTPPESRGRGIAEQLVRAALADARQQGRKVAPACSYVAAFIQRHPEYQDLLG